MFGIPGSIRTVPEGLSQRSARSGKKGCIYIVTKQEYIDNYRFNYEYHPYHVFSMSDFDHIAEINCSAIYIVGAQAPGYAMAMGVTTRSTFEEALQDAKRYVGDQPNILALPKSFKLSEVHQTM